MRRIVLIIIKEPECDTKFAQSQDGTAVIKGQCWIQVQIINRFEKR